MFGNKKLAADGLTPVILHTIRSAEAFAKAVKLWQVNERAVFTDAAIGKEQLRFTITSPRAVVWLQRDIGRQDVFELIVHWAQDKTMLTDISVLLPGPETAGDATYALKVLDGLLTTPAALPASNQGAGHAKA